MSTPTIPEIISEAHESVTTLLADLRDAAETLAARVALAESRERGMREGLEEAVKAHREVCEVAAQMRVERDEARRERDELRKVAEAVRAVAPYVTATIARNNSFKTEHPDWIAIHGGRASSSEMQLESLLRAATAALRSNDAQS